MLCTRRSCTPTTSSVQHASKHRPCPDFDVINSHHSRLASRLETRHACATQQKRSRRELKKSIARRPRSPLALKGAPTRGGAPLAWEINGACPNFAEGARGTRGRAHRQRESKGARTRLLPPNYFPTRFAESWLRSFLDCSKVAAARSSPSRWNLRLGERQVRCSIAVATIEESVRGRMDFARGFHTRAGVVA